MRACVYLRGGGWGLSILLRPLGRDKGSSPSLEGGLKPRTSHIPTWSSWLGSPPVRLYILLLHLDMVGPY